MLLYTLGDSFTYGDELAHPGIEAWPVKLANKLNYTIVNHGQSGCSNAHIVKTAIKNIDSLKPDLVIIAWTSFLRMEFSDNVLGKWHTWPGRDVTFTSETQFRETLLKYITVYQDFLCLYENYLLDIITMQNYLKIRGIEYRFINAFHYDKSQADYFVDSRLKLLRNQIDFDKFWGWPDIGIIEWLYVFMEDGLMKKEQRGHPDAQGHICIANKMFSLLGQDGYLPHPEHLGIV